LRRLSCPPGAAFRARSSSLCLAEREKRRSTFIQQGLDLSGPDANTPGPGPPYQGLDVAALSLNAFDCIGVNLLSLADAV